MTRTYLVETYGCQMNVHDSERIAGLLEADGYVPVETGKQADLVVFNTCAVRENSTPSSSTPTSPSCSTTRQCTTSAEETSTSRDPPTPT
jgi:hypothetical protein